MKKRLRKLLFLRSIILVTSLVLVAGVYQNSNDVRPRIRRISHTPSVVTQQGRPSPAQKFEALKMPQVKIEEPVVPALKKEVPIAQEVSADIRKDELIALAEKQVAMSDVAMESMKSGTARNEIPQELKEKIATLPVSAQYLIHLATLLPDRDVQVSN